MPARPSPSPHDYRLTSLNLSEPAPAMGITVASIGSQGVLSSVGWRSPRSDRLTSNNAPCVISLGVERVEA